MTETTSDTPMKDAQAESWIGTHRDGFRCVVVENRYGSYDVALVVDGGYGDAVTADEMAAFWLERAREEFPSGPEA